MLLQRTVETGRKRSMSHGEFEPSSSSSTFSSSSSSSPLASPAAGVLASRQTVLEELKQRTAAASPQGSQDNEEDRQSLTPEEESQRASNRLRMVFMQSEAGKIVAKGGVFPKLAEWVCSLAPEKKQTRAFLLSYRIYGTADELLAVLFSLLGYSPKAAELQDFVESNSIISKSKQNKIIAFIFDWVETYFFTDFYKKPAYSRLLNFAKANTLMTHEDRQKLKLTFIHKPASGNTTTTTTNPLLSISSTPSLTNATPSPSSPSIASNCYSNNNGALDASHELLFNVAPQVLAEQLTVLDWKLFTAIRPEELIGCGWTKKNKEEVAPNLLRYSQRFNQISWWVATQIVLEQDPKKQKFLVKKFISVADKCRALSNYNSMMAILAGLNNFSVQRLKKCWMISARYKETFERLERIMAPQQNFKYYRKEVAKKNPPLIPYLVMYLRDLTFVYDGNPDYLDDEKTLVNFMKMELVEDQLGVLMELQRTPYELGEVTEVTAHLLNVKYLEDDDLHKASLICEPSHGQGLLSESEKAARVSIFNPQNKTELAKGLSFFFVYTYVVISRTPSENAKTNIEPISWTVEDTQEWLEAKGYGDYKRIFLSKMLDGAQVLDLDNRKLLSLGIDNLVDRKKLLKEIQALVAAYSSSKLSLPGSFSPSSSLSSELEAMDDTWKSKSPIYWSAEEVCLWLRSIELEDYQMIFLENSVTGMELMDLENDDLITLHVTRLGHRKRLMKHIRLLRTKPVIAGGGRRNSSPTVLLANLEMTAAAINNGKDKKNSWDMGHTDALLQYSKKGTSEYTSDCSDSDNDSGFASEPEADEEREDLLDESTMASKGNGKTRGASGVKSRSGSSGSIADAVNAAIRPEGLIMVKCYWNDDIRTLWARPDVSLEQLKQQITEEYQLKNTSTNEDGKEGGSPRRGFILKYKDLEDDRITIRCEDDLRFAMLIGMSSTMKLFVYAS
ncbi:hypothetical protein QOT17_019828 [Balamuthia mandrillaris]